MDALPLKWRAGKGQSLLRRLPNKRVGSICKQ